MGRLDELRSLSSNKGSERDNENLRRMTKDVSDGGMDVALMKLGEKNLDLDKVDDDEEKDEIRNLSRRFSNNIIDNTLSKMGSTASLQAQPAGTIRNLDIYDTKSQVSGDTGRKRSFNSESGNYSEYVDADNEESDSSGSSSSSSDGGYSDDFLDTSDDSENFDGSSASSSDTDDDENFQEQSSDDTSESSCSSDDGLNSDDDYTEVIKLVSSDSGSGFDSLGQIERDQHEKELKKQFFDHVKNSGHSHSSLIIEGKGIEVEESKDDEPKRLSFEEFSKLTKQLSHNSIEDALDRVEGKKPFYFPQPDDIYKLRKESLDSIDGINLLPPKSLQPPPLVCSFDDKKQKEKRVTPPLKASDQGTQTLPLKREDSDKVIEPNVVFVPVFVKEEEKPSRDQGTQFVNRKPTNVNQGTQTTIIPEEKTNGKSKRKINKQRVVNRPVEAKSMELPQQLKFDEQKQQHSYAFDEPSSPRNITTLKPMQKSQQQQHLPRTDYFPQQQENQAELVHEFPYSKSMKRNALDSIASNLDNMCSDLLKKFPQSHKINDQAMFLTQQTMEEEPKRYDKIFEEKQNEIPLHTGQLQSNFLQAPSLPIGTVNEQVDRYVNVDQETKQFEQVEIRQRNGGLYQAGLGTCQSQGIYKTRNVISPFAQGHSIENEEHHVFEAENNPTKKHYVDSFETKQDIVVQPPGTFSPVRQSVQKQCVNSVKVSPRYMSQHLRETSQIVFTSGNSSQSSQQKNTIIPLATQPQNTSLQLPQLPKQQQQQQQQQPQQQYYHPICKRTANTDNGICGVEVYMHESSNNETEMMRHSDGTVDLEFKTFRNNNRRVEWSARVEAVPYRDAQYMQSVICNFVDQVLVSESQQVTATANKPLTLPLEHLIQNILS